jgi:hypothetical protein
MPFDDLLQLFLLLDREVYAVAQFFDRTDSFFYNITY